ncbi:MAG: hypothetical protein MZV64_19115 [Ignavibacteriales bacterium]|nr:hypothetical protein [Ignavibacteriales bacterium]
MNDSGHNFIKMVREMMDHAIEIGADVLHQTEAACRDADLIIHTFSHAVGAHTLAREKDIPDIHIQTFPMFTPTGDYPNVTMPDLKFALIESLNTCHLKKDYLVDFHCLDLNKSAAARDFPNENCISHLTTIRFATPTPILCAWSPSVLPHSSDWNLQHRAYVRDISFSISTASISHSLLNCRTLLDAGTPPVCVSFGSMVNRDAETN